MCPIGSASTGLPAAVDIGSDQRIFIQLIVKAGSHGAILNSCQPYWVRAFVHVCVHRHMASPAADIWKRWEKWRGSCGALMVSARRILLQAERAPQVLISSVRNYTFQPPAGLWVKIEKKGLPLKYKFVHLQGFISCSLCGTKKSSCPKFDL